MAKRHWENINHEMPERSYTCGYCGRLVGPNKGYQGNVNITGKKNWHIYICPYCDKATFFDDKRQTPGPLYGSDVDCLPQDLLQLYLEARGCVSFGSYTSAVLTCRKILMHVAVEKGCKPGESFVSYVQYLLDSGYIHRDARAWVDHIRTKGNEANHQIVVMDQEEARGLISLCEFLLKTIYELPSKVPGTEPRKEAGK